MHFNFLDLGDRETKLKALHDKVYEALQYVCSYHDDCFGLNKEDLDTKKISLETVL